VDAALKKAKERTPPKAEASGLSPLAPEDFEVGQTVTVRSLKAEGRLESTPDAKGFVRLTVGGARVTVPVEDLFKKEGPKKKPAVPRVRIQTSAREDPLTTSKEDLKLDMRGMRADDARDRVGEFLDRAWRSGWKKTTIIHGHGTGVLKREVREFLKTAPYKLTFRPGDRYEGGDGATVVEMDFSEK